MQLGHEPIPRKKAALQQSLQRRPNQRHGQRERHRKRLQQLRLPRLLLRIGRPEQASEQTKALHVRPIRRLQPQRPKHGERPLHSLLQKLDRHSMVLLRRRQLHAHTRPELERLEHFQQRQQCRLH